MKNDQKRPFLNFTFLSQTNASTKLERRKLEEERNRPQISQVSSSCFSIVDEEEFRPVSAIGSSSSCLERWLRATGRWDRNYDIPDLPGRILVDPYAPRSDTSRALPPSCSSWCPWKVIMKYRSYKIYRNFNWYLILHRASNSTTLKLNSIENYIKRKCKYAAESAICNSVPPFWPDFATSISRDRFRNEGKESTPMGGTKSTPLSQRLTMINWSGVRHIRTGTRQVAFYFRYRRRSVNTRHGIRLRSAKPTENYTAAFLCCTRLNVCVEETLKKNWNFLPVYSRRQSEISQFLDAFDFLFENSRHRLRLIRETNYSKLEGLFQV